MYNAIHPKPPCVDNVDVWMFTNVGALMNFKGISSCRRVLLKALVARVYDS